MEAERVEHGAIVGRAGPMISDEDLDSLRMCWSRECADSDVGGTLRAVGLLPGGAFHGWRPPNIGDIVGFIGAR